VRRRLRRGQVELNRRVRAHRLVGGRELVGLRTLRLTSPADPALPLGIEITNPAQPLRKPRNR